METPSGRPRIFKTRWFERFAGKEDLDDRALTDAVLRAEAGQVDADLGGGVIKQRIARTGQGKSGGYRTIVFFRRGARAVFAYGFAKRDRANIDVSEQQQFKEAAGYVLRLTNKQIDELLHKGDFVEVRYEQEVSK
ncbi:MAG: type II toxin-antitoxin system RelE/ParE family toxin [Bryobacterales bacterium]|nr:type II toxin-antitoxin system RelE/ParE family toxin [Bryobacterales bacterium]